MSFDIKEHKWSDKTVELDDEFTSDTALHLYCHFVGEVFINKKDAIAIAKHFGLIGGESVIVFSPDHEMLNNTPFPMMSDVNWYDIPSTEIKHEQ